MDFTIGETRFELYHAGQAHTPGDIFIWLPDQRVVFTGDIVYMERMLRIGAMSNSGSWVKAFEAMAALEPRHVVPGHGGVTSLEHARRDTYDYLVFLRQAVTEFMDAGGIMEDISKIDQSRFSYLDNYESLKGRNAQQVYQELEWQ